MGRGRHSLPLEVGDAEEDLDHRVEVAAVTQVPDARVARPKQGLQWHARLLDQLPFADPLVHVYLQLSHGLVRLQGKRHFRLGEKLSPEVFTLIPRRVQDATLWKLRMCSIVDSNVGDALAISSPSSGGPRAIVPEAVSHQASAWGRGRNEFPPPEVFFPFRSHPFSPFRPPRKVFPLYVHAALSLSLSPRPLLCAHSLMCPSV